MIDVYNMHGWFQKLWKSRISSSAQREQEAMVTENSESSVRSTSTPPPIYIAQLFFAIIIFQTNTASLRSELAAAMEPKRDACPGGAISTELCQAVKDSHIRALLITPGFLQDDWCKYMMHQVLAEAPMSNRIIPLVQNLPHSQYPQELRFYFYTDLGKNPDSGYTKVNTTVLKYLEDLLKNEKTLDGLS
ncbi:hypothetical protein VZT92_020485 [Zoarces viviparus]|uniref:TIR domain-containing protein n=1 Tax=Zoarces viviparus TaxID=48416 RepID=A0AAW1EF55_ZOAVI